MLGFLIEFNRRTGARRIHEFDTLREAMQHGLALEDRRENNDDEIIALGSTSLESLQRTHARYFMGKEVKGQ